MMQAPPAVRRITDDDGTVNGGGVASSSLNQERSAALKQFAALLGGTATTDLLKLVSSNVGEDQVVLTLPCLDLKLASASGDDKDGSNSILPAVGQHSQQHRNQSYTIESLETTASNATTTTTAFGEDHRPNMHASVLSITCDSKLANCSVKVDPQTAQNIGKRTSWTRSTLCYSSSAVNTNLSDSFTVLLNSRLKAWTLVLLRHSLNTGNGESRSRLLSMLSAKIKVQSAETCYKTLSLPEAVANAKPKDADCILPLLLEVQLQVRIQEKPETVVLRAPGTVTAIFDNSENNLTLLQKVHVRLDTGVLLNSMADQARIVVLKAVATATNTPVHVPPSTLKSREDSAIASSTSIGDPSGMSQTTSSNDPAMLGSIRTAVHLPVASDARLQKARTSALRLNSVLHGKKSVSTAGIPGIRSVRSVKWETSITPNSPQFNAALAPNPKRLRMAQTAARLKSYKSFGRPHAGDFGSGPRNATFSEYGAVAVWGRDGRLAQHPMPQQGVAAVDSMGNLTGGSADKNATFDSMQQQQNRTNAFFRTTNNSGEGVVPMRSAAASAGAALLGRTVSTSMSPLTRVASGLSRSPSSSIPRTATALESSLMKKWSNAGQN